MVGRGGVDAYGTQWFFWYAELVLRGREGFAYTNLMFHPVGKDLLTHTGGNLLDALLALPLRAALGPTLGYNLWISALLAGNAWAGARMAAALGAPPGHRWPAALALVWNPYVLMEIQLGRPTQAFLLFPGLAAALLWSMRTPSAAVGCGVLLGLTGWTYWYHGLVLGLLAVIHGILRAAAGPERLRTFGLHALAALVCLAVVLPAAWPMLAALEAGTVPGLLALDGTGAIAPLALRTVDGEAEGLWLLGLVSSGSLIDEGGLRWVPGARVVSWVHALVAAVGLWRIRSGWALAWLCVALFVASGPLVVHGDGFVVNRPWLWMIQELDILRRWWWPARAVFAAHLLVAALVPVVLGAVGPRLRPWFGAALLLGVAVDLRREELLPLTRWDATPGRVLSCLASEPEGAVIDLPLTKDQKNLWFQTHHGQPMLGGMLAKKPSFGSAAVATLLEENDLARVLVAIGDRHYTANLDVADGSREALTAVGYRYVLARKDAFSHERTRGDVVTQVSDWARAGRLVERVLGAPPVAEDDGMALWTIDGAKVGCAP